MAILTAGSLEIRLFADLARLQSDMNKANKTVDSAMSGIDKSVRVASRAFAGLAGAVSFGAVVKMADAYKRFDSQLKLATSSVSEYNKAYSEVIRIGRLAQSDIGAIGVLYARLTNNLREFGTAQKDISKITESVALSLRVSNSTVQETNSVMLQLSQSFGSGRLNGQEFLAVSEGAPIIMRQLAKSLGVTYGELKKLAEQGKLTAEKLKNALTDPAYLEGLREQVKHVGTISSAMTVFTNNLTQFIGEADKANGASKILTTGIIFLADNLSTLVSGAMALLALSITKNIQGMYASIVASRLKMIETVKNTILETEASKVQENYEKVKTANILGLNQLKMGSKIRLLELQVLEAQSSLVLVAGTAKEVVATEILTKATYSLVMAKGALAKVNGVVGVSLANNAALTTQNALAASRLAAANVALTATTSTTAVALTGLKAVLAALGGWVGIAIIAVVLFAAEIYGATKRALGFKDAITGMSKAMEKLAEERKKGLSKDDPLLAEKKALVNLEVQYEAAIKTKNKFAESTRTGRLVKDLDLIEIGELGTGGISNAAKLTEEYTAKVKDLDFQIQATTASIARQTAISITDGKTKIKVTDEQREAYLKAQIASGSAEGKRLQYEAKLAEYLAAGRAANKTDAEMQEGIQAIKDAYYAKNNKAAIKELSDKEKARKQIQDEIIDLEEVNKLLARGFDLNEANTIAKLRAQGATDAQIVSLLNLRAAQDDSIKATKDAIALEEEIEKSLEASELAILDKTEAILKSAEALETENANFGKLESAIIATTIAKLEDTKVTLENLKLSTAAVEEQIANYKRLLAAQRNNEGLEKDKKANEEAEKAFKDAEEGKIREVKQTSDKISNIFREGFANMVNGGKGTWKSFTQSLITTFKTTVADQIYKMLLQPFVIKLIASVIGVSASGAASAAGGGIVDSITGGGGGIFDTISNGLSSLNNNVVGSIEKLGVFLSNGQGGLGDTINGFLGQNASTIAGALAFSGAALSLLKGDIKGAVFQGVGAGIGLAFGGPVGGAIGSFLGGAIGGLFGKDKTKRPVFISSARSTFENGKLSSTFGNLAGQPKQVKSLGADESLASVSGVFSQSLAALLGGFNLSTKITSDVRLWKRKAALGWFNASFGEGSSISLFSNLGRGDASAAFQAFFERVLSEGIVTAIQKTQLPEGIKQLFSGLTTSTQVTNMINASLSLNAAQKQLADRFGLTVDQAGKVSVATGLVGDELAKFVVKLGQSALAFQTVGEALISVKNNLATGIGGSVPDTIKGFDDLLKSIDKTGSAGQQMFADLFGIRDQFIAFTQAIDGLKGNVRGALFGIVSDAEKQQFLNEDLAKLFSDLNRTVPGSIQELIDLGKSIDYTTKEGLDLAAVFPTLVSAFKQTQDAAESLFNTLRDESSFKTLVDFTRYQRISQNYGTSFAGSYVDSLPSFAVGSNYIPNDMTANIHAGERIIPAADNAEIISSLRGGNNAAMVTEIRALRQEVALLRNSSEKTSIHAKRAADVLVNVSPNGNALQTEALV